MAQNKRAGRKSAAQNDFLEPLAPINVSVADIGTNRSFNDGAVTVSFSLPENSPVATSYTATSSPGGFTTTGSSSPLTVTGLQSDTAYTFTVTATNASGVSQSSAASASVTATTVPATPGAPSVSSPSGTSYDTVSWSAPANGGKAITNYYWQSSDGKSGNTSSTSVNVNQEAGTSQTYTVRADNANGSSVTSNASGSVTTFSFTPFSFVPYSFVPYSFVPYSFTPYSFTPTFSFVPYAFTPYSFTPTTNFTFVPYSFTPAFSFAPTGYYFVPTGKSIGPETLVLTTNGLTAASNIAVGDTLVSVNLPGLGEGFGISDINMWSSSETNFDFSETTTTTVTHVVNSTVPVSVLVNGELFSGTHFMLTKRDGLAKMITTIDLLETDELWSTVTGSWTPITQLIKKDISHEVISINCEPYDMFFTDKFLVYDGYQVEL